MSGGGDQRPVRRAPIPPDTQETAATAAASGAPRATQDRRETPTMDELSFVGEAGNIGVSDALAALARMGAAVRALGEALDISQATLAATEAFDSLECQTNGAVERVAAIPQSALREGFARFSDDLEIDLSLSGLDPTLEPIVAELRATPDGAWSRALADFRAAAEGVASTQGDSVSVDITLRIFKRGALIQADRLREKRESHGARGAPTACVVFYSAEALRRRLTLQAATLWSARGLGGEERRTLVVACDAVGYLAGVALEVIGAAGSAPSEWLTLSPQAWRRFALRMARSRSLRASESAWNGVNMPFLTDHLRVTHRMPGLDLIADRLAELRAGAAACELASAVDSGQSARGDQSVGSVALLRFAGTRPATLRLDLAAPAGDGAGATRSASSDAGGAGEMDEMVGVERTDDVDSDPDPLIELATWAYRDASPDRLAIARDALGREAPPAADVTLQRLHSIARPALDAARANLTIYLRGAAARYFQLRDAAQTAVSVYADATRKAVTDLTSDVVDNLFKTVGLIAGVVIAGLISPTASRPVAAIAALIYTGYVVFILWYLLRARYARYLLERSALDRTLAAMDELTSHERAALARPATDASAHFVSYYRLTWWIYVALALAGVVVFLLTLTPAWLLIAPAPTVPAPAATRPA